MHYYCQPKFTLVHSSYEPHNDWNNMSNEKGKKFERFRQKLMPPTSMISSSADLRFVPSLPFAGSFIDPAAAAGTAGTLKGFSTGANLYSEMNDS